MKPTLPPAAIKSTVTVKADRPKSSAAAKKPAAAFSAATKKKPASSSSSAIASTTSLAPKKESFDILFKFSDESAEELIQTFVDPAPTVSQETEEGGAETAVDKAGLASSNWKTRLSSK